MFVQSVAVDLEAPVFRMRAELGKTAREVRFNIPSNVFQYLCSFYFANVFHGSRRVSTVDRMRTSAQEPVIMNYSSSRFAIFCRCAARNTPEIRFSKELSYYIGRSPRIADHSASLHFFLHGFPQDRLTLSSRQWLVVNYMSPRFWWVILEVADKSCCKALHHLIFHLVVDQVSI